LTHQPLKLVPPAHADPVPPTGPESHATWPLLASRTIFNQKTPLGAG
jgi:hypothetical protein